MALDTTGFRLCVWRNCGVTGNGPAAGGSPFLQAPCYLCASGVQPFFLCGAHSFSRVFLTPPRLVSFSFMCVFGVQMGCPHLRSVEGSGKEWAQVEEVCAQGGGFEQGCQWSSAGGTMTGVESSCRRGAGARVCGQEAAGLRAAGSSARGETSHWLLKGEPGLRLSHWEDRESCRWGWGREHGGPSSVGDTGLCAGGDEGGRGMGHAGTSAGGSWGRHRRLSGDQQVHGSRGGPWGGVLELDSAHTSCKV